MADVITRFKLETSQYDSKLRDSAKSLSAFSKQAEMAGKDFDKFTKSGIESARALGQVASGANNTKDKLKDLVGAYNDVAKAYNKLTEEQRQSDFAKAMASSLEQLQVRIKETKEELYSLGDSVKGKGGLFGEDGLTGMLQVFGGNLLTKGFEMLASGISDTWTKSIELARAGEGVRIAFERLNQPGLLDRLKEATHGTVSEVELMKQAIKFENFKLPLEDLATYLSFAQQKAKDTGESIDYLVNSIVNGLGRQSKQILDNLGISAAELTKRMNEGADMTKAVADIIREEMEKAGDYVETAADRAAKAAAKATDEMEKFGQQAAPIAEAWGETWNAISIGAMELANTLLGPVAESIRTLQNIWNNGWEDNIINSPYNIENGKYNPKSGYQGMGDLQKVTAPGGYVEVTDKNTGAVLGGKHFDNLDDKNAINAWRKALNKTKKTPTTKQPKTETELNQAKIKALTQEYIKLGDKETETAKKRQIEIQKEIDLLQKRNNLIGLRTEQAQGKFLGGNVQINGLSTTGNIIDRSHLFDTEGGINWQKLQKYNEQTSVAEYKRRRKEWESEEKNKNKNKKNSEYDKDDSAVSQLLKLNEGVAGMAKGLEQMGIELPEGFKSVINGIQGVLSMLESINTIVAAIQGLQEVGTFLGIFSHGGTVRAAQGYYVPGTHASGDVTPILANAGELVLNKSSQNNLANELKGAEALVQTIDRYQTSIMRGSQYNYGTPTIGGGMLGNMKLETLITGEQIRLVLNNNGRRTGRGEYITTNFK